MTDVIDLKICTFTSAGFPKSAGVRRVIVLKESELLYRFLSLRKHANGMDGARMTLYESIIFFEDADVMAYVFDLTFRSLREPARRPQHY